MKRTIFTLLALSVAVALACKRQKRSRKTGNAWSSVRVPQEHPVTIDIKYEPSDPPVIEVSGPTPDTVFMDRLDRIRWYVSYTSSSSVEATVRIDNIRDDTGEPAYPFESVNKFKIGPIPPNQTNPRERTTRAVRYGLYTYSVSVELHGVARLIRDPQIAIGTLSR